MPYYKKLVGKKCYLSPCDSRDAEKWTEWFNDLEVTIPLGDEAYTPFSLKASQKMIDDITQQQHIFSILALDGDLLIGRCLLFNLDWVNRSAMIGIAIGEKSYWSKGYGQEAMRLLLEYGFCLLNLNSVMLGVFDFNRRAIQCYNKLGFKEIGRRRQARIIGSQKVDAILMDILAEEFRPKYIESILRQNSST